MSSGMISLAALIILCIGFVLVMRRNMKRDNEVNRLILAFYDRSEIQQPELINEIYNYCKKDIRLKSIVATHGAKEADFNMLFEKLIYWGNFKKGHRYVPITSFFYAGSLAYLLKHKNDDAKKLTMKMMNYFHI